MLAPDGVTFAHGIGGARELPIPPELAIAGAVAALTVSFTVLAVAWRTPRYDAGTGGRPVPRWVAGLVDAAWSRVAVRCVGLVLAGYAGAAAVFGKDLLTNPFFGMVYVWWWVGLVPLSLLLGPVWKALSPARTVNLGLTRLIGGAPGHGLLAYPDRLGYWPAAVGLYSFVWMELVYPGGTELGPVRLWCAAYAGAMLVGGVLFGAAFYERADPFEVYSSLVGRLSVWGRRGGRLVLRSPLANLATIPAGPGLVGVVAVLFGSTGFDSFSASNAWVTYTQATTRSVTLLESLALLGFCVGVGVVLSAACAATGVGPECTGGGCPPCSRTPWSRSSWGTSRRTT